MGTGAGPWVFFLGAGIGGRRRGPWAEAGARGGGGGWAAGGRAVCAGGGQEAGAGGVGGRVREAAGGGQGAEGGERGAGSEGGGRGLPESTPPPSFIFRFYFFGGHSNANSMVF